VYWGRRGGHDLLVRRVPLPEPLRARPFSVGEASALGLPRSRLRAADLVSPHRGVRASVVGEGALAACSAVAPLLRPDEFVAHVTALWLWGLPLPGRHEGGAVLHLGSARARQRRRAGVVGHLYSGGCRVHVVRGIRVASPVDAWVQAAPDLSTDELVVLGEALAGRWSPLAPARDVEVGRLVDAVAAAQGRRGARALREAVELVRPGVMSPRETVLRLLLTRAGLPEPAINAPAHGASGRYLGRPDLSWPEARLGVEYEGDVHRDRDVFRRDVERVERFHDEGWRLIRVSGDDLRPPRDRHLIERVAGALAARTS